LREPKTLWSLLFWWWWYEFGFNLSTQRNYARSHEGSPAIVISPLCSAANVSVCVAINSNHGIFHWHHQHQPYTKISFNSFIEDLSEKIAENHIRDSCIILDNASIHNENEIKEKCQNHGVFCQFLSPYSPMFNPIEEVFKDIKHNIRTLFATTYRQNIINISSMPLGHRQEERRNVLNECLIQSIGNIDIAKIQSHINHSMSFIPKAIRMEDL